MDLKKENESKTIIFLKRLFLLFVFVICTYFVIGQNLLSKEQEIGEFLKGKTEVGNVMYFDSETGLNLLIGSKHYTNSTELVSGERMRSLLKAVRKYADYVVIDTPPTSLMADAEIMAEYDEMRIIADCHSKAYRYPVIKRWFLEKYPEITTLRLAPREEVKDNVSNFPVGKPENEEVA